MKTYTKPELEKIDFTTEQVMADVGVGEGSYDEEEPD